MLKPFFELDNKQEENETVEVTESETEQEAGPDLADILDTDMNDQDLMLDLESLLGGPQATRTFLCDACGKLQSNISFDDDQTA